MNPTHSRPSLAVLAALALTPHPAAAQALPALNMDPARTTVSGLSSGAYMAGQFHVAFSAEVTGAALVGGGPFGCAEGRLELATQRCMATNLGEPDPKALATAAAGLAAAGEIDALANLLDDRIYVFAGTADRTVLPRVGASAAGFYQAVGVPAASVRLEATTPAGHGFASEDGPVACGDTGPPFVNDCDLDQAREALAFLQGSLNPPGTPSEPSGFDQRLYLPNPEPRGMAETGWVYVPAGCTRGDRCRVHVVFHGCKQSAELVGEAVTVGAGYNRWAETNGIVVLYPQAHATWSNPNACWDWWGYTGKPYSTKRGVQLAAVHRMVLALAGRAGDGDGSACVRHGDWNLTHWQRGRAIACGWGFACAAGSGDVLGPFVSASEVFEHPVGFYTAEPCGG